jgi:hypothetical protein
VKPPNPPLQRTWSSLTLGTRPLNGHVVGQTDMLTDDDLIAEVRRKMDPGAVGPPISTGAMEQAERLLGFTLPALVRRLYTELGDGGFGPGYGFLPLLEAEHNGSEEAAVGLYLAFRQGDPEDASWLWPAGLLPICDWGCAIRSCVDCTRPQGSMSVFDPGAHGIGDPMTKALLSNQGSVADFLRAWISDVDIWGQMFESDDARTVRFRNPFSGKDSGWLAQRLKK